MAHTFFEHNNFKIRHWESKCETNEIISNGFINDMIARFIVAYLQTK